MNCWSRTAITALLVFSLSGCAASRSTVTGTLPGTAAPVSAASGESVSEAALMETLFSSYYEGQDSHAFEMLHKKIFSRLIRPLDRMPPGFSAAMPRLGTSTASPDTDILDPELRSNRPPTRRSTVVAFPARTAGPVISYSRMTGTACATSKRQRRRILTISMPI